MQNQKRATKIQVGQYQNIATYINEIKIGENAMS